jgi:hypothetical protein
MAKSDSDHFSDAETERRPNAALKRMLATPSKPHTVMKKGRRSPKGK